MKKIPETNAKMVRCGRIWPTLLRMKAVNTKSKDTMGKGVAVRTISVKEQNTIRCVSETEQENFQISPSIYSLRIFAVFSVVISTSGSVKYSEATHFPFSEPERKTKQSRVSA